MSVTTIKVDTSTRDRLSAIAQARGVSKDAALQLLLDEHEMNQVHAAYARLRDNPAEWADYTRELGELEAVAGDGLGDAADEYPEQNR
jgi:predicted transcriptional regulator